MNKDEMNINKSTDTECDELVQTGEDAYEREQEVTENEGAINESAVPEKKKPKWLRVAMYVVDILVCAILVICAITALYGVNLYYKMKSATKELVTSFNKQELSSSIQPAEEPYFNADGSLSEVCIELMGGSDYREQAIKNINGDNMTIEKYISFKEYFDKQLEADKEGIKQLMSQMKQDDSAKYITNYKLLEQVLKNLDNYSDDYVYYVLTNYSSDIDSMEYMRAGIGGLTDIIEETNQFAVSGNDGAEINPKEQTTFVMNLSDIIDRVVVDDKLKSELYGQSAMIDRLVNNYIGLGAMLKSGEDIQSQLSNSESKSLLESLQITNLDYTLSQLDLIMNGDMEVRTLYFNDETQSAYDELNKRTERFKNYVDFVPLLNKFFDKDKILEMSANILSSATESTGRADTITYTSAFNNPIFKQDLLGMGLTSAMFTNMSSMYVTDDVLSINESRLGVMFELPLSTFKPVTTEENGAQMFAEYLDGAMLAINGLQAGGESFLEQYYDEDGNLKEDAVFDKSQVGYKELMTYYAIYGSMQNRANNFATY